MGKRGLNVNSEMVRKKSKRFFQSYQIVICHLKDLQQIQINLRSQLSRLGFYRKFSRLKLILTYLSQLKSKAKILKNYLHQSGQQRYLPKKFKMSKFIICKNKMRLNVVKSINTCVYKIHYSRYLINLCSKQWPTQTVQDRITN